MIWAGLKIGNLKEETESLLITGQNNAIRTDYTQAKIFNSLKNSKYKLCGGRHETVNHDTTKCGKLVQKEYKTRTNMVGKVIHWELCKKLKSDLTVRYYLPTPPLGQDMTQGQFLSGV